MLTCPNCRQVLLTPSLCFSSLLQKPPQEFLALNTENGSTTSDTPRVNGHVFHFPTLACACSCQLLAQIQCRVHPCVSVTQAEADSCTESSLQHFSGLPSSDDHVLAATKGFLLESHWYWQKMTWQQAEVQLGSSSVGTFLVRDSSDARFAYSLSVQTEKGPTSVRLCYQTGKFCLDSDPSLKFPLPAFPGVIQLIEYYIKESTNIRSHVWKDAYGKVHSPIILLRPLRKTLPSLKHLCRLTINKTLPVTYIVLKVPPSLASYINSYPFWC